MVEIWKDIEGYEGLYQISNFGRIKSYKRRGAQGGIKSFFHRKLGYKGMPLYKNSKMETFLVHRLVAKAFIPNPNDYPCVCHIDDKPSNNRVDNLFWGTHRMNMEDMARKKRNKGARGIRNYNAKLNDEKVRRIRKLKTEDPKISGCKVAKMFDVSRDVIYDIWNNIAWKHVTI